MLNKTLFKIKGRASSCVFLLTCLVILCLGLGHRSEGYYAGNTYIGNLFGISNMMYGFYSHPSFNQAFDQFPYNNYINTNYGNLAGLQGRYTYPFTQGPGIFGAFSLPNIGLYNNFSGTFNSSPAGYYPNLVSFNYNYVLPYGGGSWMSLYSPLWSFNRPISSNDPQPPPSQASLDPRPGDENLTRGQVYVNETQILILESFPPQINLQVKGNLPTPCHQLRAVVSAPDAQNRIAVELYSLSDPGVTCIQVLEPFDRTISLGSFTQGSFTVWLNAEHVGEFTI